MPTPPHTTKGQGGFTPGMGGKHSGRHGRKKNRKNTRY